MSKEPVIRTREAILPDDIDFISRLWIDYLTWANENMQVLYGVHPHLGQFPFARGDYFSVNENQSALRFVSSGNSKN
jgi:hypothetical protein